MPERMPTHSPFDLRCGRCFRKMVLLNLLLAYLLQDSQTTIPPQSDNIAPDVARGDQLIEGRAVDGPLSIPS